MRKEDNRKKRKEKIMLFLVATNVVASRPTDWNAARSCQFAQFGLILTRPHFDECKHPQQINRLLLRPFSQEAPRLYLFLSRA